MHGLVYVIGEDVHEQLDPFNEYSEVEPYKEYVTEYDLKDMIIRYNTTNIEELRQNCSDYFGSEGEIDEKGLFYWCDINPNGRFDWWEEGGRWDYNLLLKNGDFSNSALNIHIDWNKMITNQYKYHLANYKKITHPKNKLIRVTDPSFDRQYDIKKGEREKDYVRRMSKISPYAFVIDYEWYDLKDEIKEIEFRKIIQNLDDNERITVVDIHY